MGIVEMADNPESMTGLNCSRGFSYLSLLGALLIIGLLFYFFLGPTTAGLEKAKQLPAVKKAGQETACSMNRQAIEKAALTWSVTHPGESPSIPKLEQSGIYVPACPEGGKLTIQGNKVICSLHSKP